jgi:hypothetical protein
VVFDNNPTLVYGTNLILPGGANITATPGDTATFYGDAGGVVRCVSYVSLTPAATVVVPYGYIGGFTMTYASYSGVAIAAGQARDSTNTYTIAPLGMTKNVGGPWSPGTNYPAMGNGLITSANTWYHVFAIINGGTHDFYFDTSITAANKPAGTTAFRYIGSIKTDAGAHILPFYQVGQKFSWATPLNDLNNYTGSTSGTVTLSTPPGIVTHPILYLSCGASGNNTYGFGVISGLTGQTDGSVTSVGTVFVGYSQVQTSTNTSSQVSYTASTGNGGQTIQTLAYINPKVAPNN